MAAYFRFETWILLFICLIRIKGKIFNSHILNSLRGVIVYHSNVPLK